VIRRGHRGAVGFGVRLFDELVRHEEAAKARQH